jgi:hypothetical protein
MTLTPHIVRVLDINESDLRPFRLGRDGSTGAAPAELPNVPRDIQPRDRDIDQPPAAAQPPTVSFPQPLQPSTPFPQPLQGTLPGAPVPIMPPTNPPKKPGGGTFN